MAVDIEDSYVQSPSSRRAWIEIKHSFKLYFMDLVALLAEGVDRNLNLDISDLRPLTVALLAEGVDRNLSWTYPAGRSVCRPPRGGRG